MLAKTAYHDRIKGGRCPGFTCILKLNLPIKEKNVPLIYSSLLKLSDKLTCAHT